MEQDGFFMTLPMTLPALCTFLCLTSAALAQLGHPPITFNNRYGNHKKPSSGIEGIFGKLLPGAETRIYQKNSWRVDAAFADISAPALRVRYRILGRQLTDEDVNALLALNSDGMTWQQVPYNHHPGSAVLAGMMGVKVWRRADGARATKDTTSMQFDHPEALKLEAQNKQRKTERQRQQRPF